MFAQFHERSAVRGNVNVARVRRVVVVGLLFRATREEGTVSSEPRWAADDISAYHSSKSDHDTLSTARVAVTRDVDKDELLSLSSACEIVGARKV